MKVSSSRLEWVFLSIIVISQSSLLVSKLNRATGLGRLALMLSAEGFQVEANVSWPTKPCVRPIYLRSPRRGMCSPKTNFHRSPRMLLACFSPLLTISWTEHQKNRWCSFPWRTSSRRIMVGGPLRIWTEVVFTPSKWDYLDFFDSPLWGHAQQYTQISVPSIAPENLVNLVKSDQTRCKMRDVFCCCWKKTPNKFAAFCHSVIFALSFFTTIFFLARCWMVQTSQATTSNCSRRFYQDLPGVQKHGFGSDWQFFSDFSPTKNTSEKKGRSLWVYTIHWVYDGVYPTIQQEILNTQIWM